MPTNVYTGPDPAVPVPPETYIPETHRAETYTPVTVERRTALFERISWSAVFAGLILALMIQLLLSLLGTGIGLSTVDPATRETPGTETLSIAAGIWWTISSLIALFIGGWAAAHLAGIPHRTEGIIHGLLTWGLATLLLVSLIGTAVGTLIGGAFNVLDTNVSALAPYVAGEAAEAGREARVVADRTAEVMTQGSLWSFGALLLGAVAAALGGMCGKPRSALVSRDIRRDMEMKPMVDMTQTLARNWWAVGLRGLFALLFGVLVFFWPGISLLVLVFLFGFYVLADGIFAIVSAIRAADRHKRWWPLLLEGIVGIAAGIMAFIWPGITALVLLYLIAAWAIVTGIFEIVAAMQLRKEIEGEWLLALGGIASVVFGVLLVGFPGAGALAVVWIIGAYSMLFGILLMVLAFRLRQQNGDRSPGATARAA